MSNKPIGKSVDENYEPHSYCIILRDLRGSEDKPLKFLVEVNDINILEDADNDSTSFEKFVEEARAYFASNPIDSSDSSENYDIYIGFWGQWYCGIPASFFVFVVEMGLKVSFDIND